MHESGEGVTKDCWHSAFNEDECRDNRFSALWATITDSPGYLAKKGMEQVADFFAEGGSATFGYAASAIVGHLTPDLTNSGFVYAYNLVAGSMLGLVGLHYGFCNRISLPLRSERA